MAPNCLQNEEITSVEAKPIIMGKEADAYENVCWDNRL